MQRNLAVAALASALLGVVVSTDGTPGGAADVPVGTSYPLGHHTFEFRRPFDNGEVFVTSSGWDPAYLAAAQTDKDRWTALVSTFQVGLPGTTTVADLNSTFGAAGCPVRTPINDSSDVAGLPTVELPGERGGTFHLVYDCNVGFLRVGGGMKVAFHGSRAYKLLDDSGGGTAWFFDSVIDPDGAGGGDENAGMSCSGGLDCGAFYSEVLGGDDVAKWFGGSVCFKSHFHGTDRDSEASPSEHNDVIQHNPGSNYRVINCTLDGPVWISNAPFFAGTDGGIADTRISDSLLSGGTHPIKYSDKAAATFTGEIWAFDNKFLGDSQTVSWGSVSGQSNQSDPCQIAKASGAYKGENNAVVGGLTSGTDTRSWTGSGAWSASGCNTNDITQAIRDAQDAYADQWENWTTIIRNSVP